MFALDAIDLKFPKFRVAPARTRAPHSGSAR
jgi:hypothetical protein